MYNKIFLSIIIPCYNCEKYIARTINSVLNNYNKNIEIIVVDDGSTDKSMKEAQKNLNKSNVKYKIIKQHNSGVSIARNTGIDAAEGVFIYFLDSDDYINEELINNLEDKVKEEDCDAIIFGYNRENEKRVYWRYEEQFNYPNKTLTGEEICELYLKQDIGIHLCSFIIKKEIINRYRIGFRENCFYGEDIEFIIKALINCKRISYIEKELFCYFEREDSTIKNFSEKRFTGMNAIDGIKNYLIQNNFNNSNIIKLIDKRRLKEIVYIYQSYIYYSINTNKELKNKLKNLINNNVEELKSFENTTKEDKIIKKYITYMVKYPDIFSSYLNKKIYYKRIIKKYIKSIIN